MESRKEARRAMLSISLVYMVTYITRLSFGALLPEMAKQGFGKTELSLSLTALALCYGFVQLLSGALADRVSPRHLLTFALWGTSLANLLIPFCKSARSMVYVWGFNGISQAFIWPPLVRILSTVFTPREYNESIAGVNWASSVGIILLYSLSPLVIRSFHWRTVFFLVALLGALAALYWCIFMPKKLRPLMEATEKTEIAKARGKAIFSPLILTIFLAILVEGMLRDGVTTWMPSYLQETYDLSSEISILSGVLIPLLSMLNYRLILSLYPKKIDNLLSFAGIYFGVALAAAQGARMVSGRSVFFSALFTALITASMFGINMLLVGILPSHFKKTNNISTMSGILNCATYLGSMSSVYLFARVAEQESWGAVVRIWRGLALLGLVFALLAARPWQKSFGEE